MTMTHKKITRNKILFVLSLSTILFSVAGIHNNLSYAEPDPDYTHAPDKLLVKFKKNVAQSSQDQILKENNAKQIHEIPKIKLKVLSIPSNSLEKIESKLQKHPLVEYVERDYYFEPSEVIPNDELYSLQWHHENLRMSNAWNISTGSLRRKNIYAWKDKNIYLLPWRAHILHVFDRIKANLFHLLQS